MFYGYKENKSEKKSVGVGKAEDYFNVIEENVK